MLTNIAGNLGLLATWIAPLLAPLNLDFWSFWRHDHTEPIAYLGTHCAFTIRGPYLALARLYCVLRQYICFFLLPAL